MSCTRAPQGRLHMPAAPDVSGLFDNLRDDSRFVKDAISHRPEDTCSLPYANAFNNPFSLPLLRLALAGRSKRCKRQPSRLRHLSYQTLWPPRRPPNLFLLDFLASKDLAWAERCGARAVRMVFIRRSNSNIVGESRLAAQSPKGGDIGLCWAAGLEIDFFFLLPQNLSLRGLGKKEGFEIPPPLPPATVYGWMDGWMMGLLPHGPWAADIESCARVGQSQRRGHYWTPLLSYSQC
ncbi:hypothetical protein V8C34DRAFT_288569 [Trichoderma compactum]